VDESCGGKVADGLDTSTSGWHTRRLPLQFVLQRLWLADEAPNTLKHPGIIALEDKIAEENYQPSASV
jgi:hypothetical protein